MGTGGGEDVVGRGGAGAAISLDDVGGGAGWNSSSSTSADGHQIRAHTANGIEAQSASAERPAERAGPGAALVADFTKDEVEKWLVLAGFGELHFGESATRAAEPS